MFVWLNTMGTHKSWKNDDGATLWEIPDCLREAALGILGPKETLATIKSSSTDTRASWSGVGQNEICRRSVSLLANTSFSWE